MPEITIADTSVLIVFDKLRQTALLKSVYRNLLVTPKVRSEFGKPLPDWIQLEHPTDQKYLELLRIQLDEGEASVIALAKEKENALVLLDDLKARKVAKQVGLKLSGTLGVLHKAKQIGHIDKIKPFLTALQIQGFYLSPQVIAKLLKLNGE